MTQDRSLLTILRGVEDLTVEHNTAIISGNDVDLGRDAQQVRFIFKNNLVRFGRDGGGIIGTGANQGKRL